MFASQLNSNQATHSLRASHYRKVKKRRRGLVEDESPSPEPDTGGTSNPKSHTYSYASPEVAQLRTAGLSHDQEDQVPASPFPHAAARATADHYGPRQIEQEIAKSPIRLYAVDAGSKDGSTSLKTQHLNVLTAVMHRCLLDEDYERAGRAWGMLLRTQIAGGRPVDPRNNDRWGIGAEILLRRRPEAPRNDENSQVPDQQTLGDEMFSEEGFELARDYYERLIIQYPYRKLNAQAVDERSFYPAMFSLWIFEIVEKSKRARKNAQRPRSRSRSMSNDSVLGRNTDDIRTREDAIQVAELARATEIAERLDQLVASPPFDKQASLLDLRGQVCLWRSALLAGDAEDDDDWDMDTTEGSHGDGSETDAARLTRLANCQRELQQAQQFFQRAEANGAPRQVASLASIDLNLRELSRQAAKLRGVQDDY
jgi:hypothetical protein